MNAILIALAVLMFFFLLETTISLYLNGRLEKQMLSLGRVKAIFKRTDK